MLKDGTYGNVYDEERVQLEVIEEVEVPVDEVKRVPASDLGVDPCRSVLSRSREISQLRLISAGHNTVLTFSTQRFQAHMTSFCPS